jgi:Fuc2NAc and GlcNAc transferase
LDNLILYLSSVTLGGAGAWFVAKWGKRLSLIDKANDRSSHDGVVPKGGGIGILAAFLLASWVLGLPVLSWICVGFVSLFSLYGDRKEIPPKVRLGIQFLAGIGLLVGLFYWESRAYWMYLLMPFFAVFAVGTANYYNFMDGINGIAGITGVVGFGLLGWFAVVEGADPRIITLSACMSLACLGFLPFNMPKARVFMGDVGSILLGFVFAAMVVWLSRSLLDFICLSAFLFPFYADELTTMAVRIRDGENLLRAHRKHLYQLLANEKGISHWKISMSYSLLQLSVGCIILLLKSYGILPVFLFLGLCYLGFISVDFRVRLSLKGIQSCDGVAK